MGFFLSPGPRSGEDMGMTLMGGKSKAGRTKAVAIQGSEANCEGDKAQRERGWRPRPIQTLGERRCSLTQVESWGTVREGDGSQGGVVREVGGHSPSPTFTTLSEVRVEPGASGTSPLPPDPHHTQHTHNTTHNRYTYPRSSPLATHNTPHMLHRSTHITHT
jgi:hypothetical protein